MDGEETMSLAAAGDEQAQEVRERGRGFLDEAEGPPASPPSETKRKFSLAPIGRRLAAVASTVGGAIARSAEAAAEVLADAELRKKGAQVIAENASKAARGIQHGIQTGASSIQRGLQTVQRGPKQIQTILLRVQQEIEQQRMAALLQEQRDAPVDVQVGCQLYEDSPQELRSRLWTALLEHPELVTEYQAVRAVAEQHRANSRASTPRLPGAASAPGTPAAAALPAGDGQRGGEGDSSAQAAAAAAPEGWEGEALDVAEPEGGAGCPAEAYSPPSSAAKQPVEGAAAPVDPAPPAAAAGSSGNDLPSCEQAHGEEGPGGCPPLAHGIGGSAGHILAPAASAEREAVVAAAAPAAEPVLDAGHLSPANSCSASRATSPAGRWSGTGAASGSRRGGVDEAASPTAGPGSSSSAHLASPSGRGRGCASGAAGAGGTPVAPSDQSSSSAGSGGVGSEGGWEVVEDGPGKQRQGQALLAGSPEGGSGKDLHSREQEAFRNKLMAAMTAVPWPLPTDYPEECRYATLLQISVGQEEVDEVISRDIHRTFPEHPLFGFEQGQQALFRVLKAYSLHDIEVGYCQGMAFVAGLLLFYMNEEPAFQMFCRLLGASGPNLRRLYLPGLEGLKAELRKFEFLMGRYLPNLKAHLEAYGVVPVLFASQWFLTAFSCPFPVHFACRLVDVMAVEGDDTIMLRTALTIMAECEADLFMLDDFEELITYLKVEPVQWPLHRVRRVLNAAVHSAITAQDLADAVAAVEEGYAGSLSRHESSLEEGSAAFFATPADAAQTDAGGGEAAEAAAAAGMPATATLQERALSLRRHSRGPSWAVAAAAAHSRHASFGAAAAADQQQQHLEEGGAAAGAAAAAGQGAGVGEGGAGQQGRVDDALEAELAKHRADMDEEYLSMVLALDMMWSGDSAEHSPEAALAAGARQQQQQQALQPQEQ